MTSSNLATDPIKFVPKGWGYEKWIVNCKDYCGKILFFAKGKQCSWHYHKLKDEVFYVQTGRVMVYYNDDPDCQSFNNYSVTILEQGDKFHIPIGMRHRVYALADSEILEISTEHFDFDSIRIEKGD